MSGCTGSPMFPKELVRTLLLLLLTAAPEIFPAVYVLPMREYVLYIPDKFIAKLKEAYLDW